MTASNRSSSCRLTADPKHTAPPHNPSAARTLNFAMLAALALAALVFASVAGCGSDTATAGPTVIAGNSDGGATDVSALADGQATADVTDAGGGLCGDGTCDPTESQATCPLDCKPGGDTGTKACLQSKCTNQMKGCATAAGTACMDFVACAATCTDIACVQVCLQKGGEPDQATKRVLQCGASKSCFAPTPTCGDGKCGPGETATTCPKDCGGGGGTPVCGDGKCENGETPFNCKQDCSVQPPVCGNGKCENGETPFNCKQDCAVQPPVCGDGKCEGSENVKTCPKDCKSGPTDPISCAKTKCASEFAYCMKDAACAKLLQCFAACKPDDSKCFLTCAQPLQGSFPAAFKPLDKCGKKFCNGGSPGACGDGVCAPDESAQSCPQDCKQTKPVCGNGKCEAPFENGFNCPQDCKQTKPVCGNDKCEAPFENGFNCPQDCKQTKPVCGDGKCQSPQENSLTCAIDCGGAQSLLDCAKAKCTKSYTACLKSKGCNKALKCMGGCATSQCIQQCAMQAQGDFQTFVPLAQCAQKAGCLSGGTSGPQCGDGTCEGKETAKNCPSDCQTGVSATCKGKCGGQSTGGCWCDDKCEQQGDCCSDKKQVCDSGPACGDGKCESGENGKSCPQDCAPPKPVCGDGVCDAATESPKSCPADCGVTQPKSCKSKNDCADSEICCNKAQGTVCVPSGQCF